MDHSLSSINFGRFLAHFERFSLVISCNLIFTELNYLKESRPGVRHIFNCIIIMPDIPFNQRIVIVPLSTTLSIVEFKEDIQTVLYNTTDSFTIAA